MKINTQRASFNFYRLFLFLLVSFLIGSCVTSKKTTYLQVRESAEITVLDSAALSYRIQANDNLYVRVITPDPKWASMFNTLPVTAPTMSVGEHSLDLISYTVRQDGSVVIPYIGPLKVIGKTIPEVQEIIEEAMTDYITDPAITVKLVNNYVSIIGEVNNPGRYPVFKAQMNIFQALAMAGDIRDYGDRSMVKIIRQTSEGNIIREFDLTDVKIIDSEFFYVMPNDVIYAKPLRGKFFAMNQFPYAIILSSITTFILIMNYIN